MDMPSEARWNYIFQHASKVKTCGEDTKNGCGCVQPIRIKKEGLADYFYLFTENIKRESVVKSADYLLKSLDQFIKIIK